MKICYNETMEDSDLANDLKLCEAYGYDLIELRLSYLLEYLKYHNVEELKSYFRTHHVKPYGFNSVDNVLFCSTSQWEQVVSEFTFACKMAKELNCPNIVVVPTEGKHMPLIPEAVVQQNAIEVLRELADIAEPYGARIAFEPIGNIRWCVHSIRQAAEIIALVDRDNVGLTIDAFNIYAHEGLRDLEDLNMIPGNKIFVYHINDAMDIPIEQLEPAQHRLYPGDGVIPLRTLHEKLIQIGYDEMASLELFGPWLSATNAETVIREGYQKIANLVNVNTLCR